MMQEDRYTEAAEHFGAIAQKYCDVVDSASNLEKRELLAQVYEILPALIDAAIRLPLPNNIEDDSEEKVNEGSVQTHPTRMNGDSWHKLYGSLKERLGDADLYWMVFDAVKGTEAIRGSLADDIADIYRDLKEGLAFKNKGSLQDAIWEWHFGFDSHWGHHAIGALKAIHDIRNY